MYLNNYENYIGRVGGGFSFLKKILDNFEIKEDSPFQFVPNPMQAELTERKIILRVDNIPELKNNRGCSISRLKQIIPKADFIIYQSEWSKEKYKEMCELNNIKKTTREKVIYNGADPKIFKKSNGTDYLYVHGKGDNKRWPEAQEIFRRIHYKNRDAKLHIIGNLAQENRDYNFGFYNGEKYYFYGTLSEQSIADIMQACKFIIYPAYADSCPNTLIEALVAGLEPIGLNSYGGQKEVYDLYTVDFSRFLLDNMIKEYRSVFNEF